MNLNFDQNKICSCGKEHKTLVEHCIVEKGAIRRVPEYAKLYHATKAFIVADVNTYPLAGDEITKMLEQDGISVSKYIFPDEHLEPDEHAVGALALHYDAQCNMIIAIGSGVINDISKILAHQTKNPYIIVATAPSMDGYASPLSSMARGGLKVSIPSKCAEVIIGDIDILKNAPLHMLKAGLGDMLAKYIALCEWRIGNLITGEYYCERIAGLVRTALKKCVDNADGILKRDETAAANVFEGLVICGVAMSYAGVSRPASGVEHYFSHVWDMRGLEMGTPVDLHGIQCAIATLLCAKLYEQVKKITPDKEKALSYAKAFDFAEWSEELSGFLGKAADTMIVLEKKEQKYNVEKHQKRLEIILDNWENILRIIDEEVPASEEIERILSSIEAPRSVEEIGIDGSILPMTLKSAKDIRDKYVLPRLLWDLGVLDEIRQSLID